MKKFRTFYHYSKFLREIKKDKWILATSLARTYTYDWILENCPEEFLNKKEIQKLKAYQKENQKIIQLYKKEQDNDENYESCYRDLRLKFKNPILNEFFNRDGYILAFSKEFEEGWMGEANKEMVASIFKKIGNEYAKIKISDEIAKRTYALEQKYWKEKYHGPILKKRFGKDWKKLAEAFSQEKFQKKKPKLRNYQKFNKYFIKLLFVKYYKSIIRIDDYKGNFKVPEFWIGEDIPVSMCKFGKVSFSELKKRLGLSKKDITKRKLTKADIAERKKKNSRSSIFKRNLELKTKSAP